MQDTDKAWGEEEVQRRTFRLIGDPPLTCHLQRLSHRRSVDPFNILDFILKGSYKDLLQCSKFMNDMILKVGIESTCKQETSAHTNLENAYELYSPRVTNKYQITPFTQGAETSIAPATRRFVVPHPVDTPVITWSGEFHQHLGYIVLLPECGGTYSERNTWHNEISNFINQNPTVKPGVVSSAIANVYMKMMLKLPFHGFKSINYTMLKPEFPPPAHCS
nr:unnamed protein product [Callosobruchus chinensis]